MPAKINIDKVTRIIGATSTADFYVQGSGNGSRYREMDKEFQDYELSHHPELTGATSIVTYILQYNGGVMPETQAELDAVLAKIPESTKKRYLSGSMSGVIQFSTIDLEMTQNGLPERADDQGYRVPRTTGRDHGHSNRQFRPVHHVCSRHWQNRRRR